MRGSEGHGLRRGFLGGLLLALAVLAGCVAAPISGERQITGQEGAVVLKLVTNGQTAADPAETLASIVIKRDIAPGSREVAGDVVTLVRTRSITNTTAVFSGMVAPGRYNLSHAVGSAGNTTYTFPLSGMLGPFDVKTGEVSLVGTVLVQPLAAQRFVVGYVPPDAELNETFEQLFPALAAQTRGKPVNTLQTTPELTRRVEIAPRFKQMPSVVNGFWQSDKGSFYAGGKIGKVMWRPAGERQWHRADVGTWREVLALRPYRGGLIAAGEEGLLRHSADDGKTWKALTAPEQGLIHTLEVLPSGKLMALVRRESSWTAYVTDDALAGSWRKLASFADERSLNVGWQQPVSLALGEKAGLALPNGEIRLVDAQTGTVERRATGHSLLGMAVLPDGALVAQSVLLTRTTLMSTDGGKTWADLNTSRFVAAIAFADRQKIYAVAPVAPGVFPGAYGLMASRDGGKTWAKTGEVPGGASTGVGVRELVIDRADGALVALMNNGSLLRSSDEGKTWTREL